MKYELHLEWVSRETGRHITTVKGAYDSENEAQKIVDSIASLEVIEGRLCLRHDTKEFTKLDYYDVAVREYKDAYPELDIVSAKEWIEKKDNFECKYRSILRSS